MLEFLKKSPDLRALLPAEALHTREVAATVTDIKYREDIDSGAHLAVKDAKGLYAKARRGELKNFTGIDSPHEPPLAPDVHLQTAKADAVTLANQMTHFLDAKPVDPGPET